MHTCLNLSDSSSSTIAVSKMLVATVTFEVSVGSLSLMLMTCDRSGVVAVAVFCHSCFWVPFVATILSVLIVVVSFPARDASGPFCIR